MPHAVSVTADHPSYTHHLVDQSLARERRKTLINGRHETSVLGLQPGRKTVNARGQRIAWSEQTRTQSPDPSRSAEAAVAGDRG